jgi:methylated-DNA-[protein]-cysteine S-methyltransferase
MVEIQYYKSPYGELVLGAYNDKLCLCDWCYRKRRDRIDKRIKVFFKTDYVDSESVVCNTAINQLEEYFQGQRQKFDISLLFTGTVFQNNVWDALLKIPFGKTKTYLDLSGDLGNELSIRAVAAANAANAISIIVPCHRVIGSNGKPVGYAGGINTKTKLLKLEGVFLYDQLELF